jgi:hypothetical protein
MRKERGKSEQVDSMVEERVQERRINAEIEGRDSCGEGGHIRCLCSSSDSEKHRSVSGQKGEVGGPNLAGLAWAGAGEREELGWAAPG